MKIRAAISTISVWVAMVAFVVVRDWWKIYEIDELSKFGSKFTKAGAFALTWEPSLFALGLGVISLIVLAWLFRESRTLQHSASGFLCGLTSAVAWGILMEAVQFAPSEPIRWLRFAAGIFTFPAAVTVGILIAAKRLNKPLLQTRASGKPASGAPVGPPSGAGGR
jgi:hypothetical membrane protein